MMEFWPENQGQLPPYAKFGTVPGRNCTHNYHDRHQAPHYPPVYYSEQQDQGRESGYWTMPGSRTGGALQEYTNWTEPELPAPTSSHFPFILDRHTQQHQDLGEYQAHEARDREWMAAQRVPREYDRGFLREGWQRRWEPCSPVRYNREVSKRTDSSYRELEAWAARYSHSLPRRRRIEAELRGASQGLLESSMDSRSGTDPRATTLQQVRQSANIRESGLWDRGVRQQAPTYYPPQVPATDTSHLLDIKEKTGYQRRMFSQPPGYIPPPPYNSPLKGSPVTHHCDTSWEQEGKRQTYWSQPSLRKQDMYDKKTKEKEDSQKLDGNQITFSELEGLKHQKQEAVAAQAGSPISIQNTEIQPECLLSLQQPQTIQAVQNTKINEETSSKVIEGRKFRLNKKTGGLTIFCLVSRIASTTETPSLPLCTSQTIIESTELGEVSKDLRDSRDNQFLADEVDFREQTLTEQSNTQPCGETHLEAKQTPTCVESEILVENLSNEDNTDVSPEKTDKIDAESIFAREVAQSVPPVPVKYPLWREPSSTSKVYSEEGASDGVQNPEDSAEDSSHPIDAEVKELDIKKDNESEDSKRLLVIDTTCVVVKMELIASPKKEHVHFLDSTDHSDLSPPDIQSTIPPECVQLTSQLNQDVATDQNAETKPLQTNESPETELDPDLVDKMALEVESEMPLPCLPSPPVPERETLEERAERILGIPLQDCVTQQQPEDATSLLEMHGDDQDEEIETSQVNNSDVNDEDDTKEEQQSKNLLEVEQTEYAVCLSENNDANDLVASEGGEDFTGPQEQASNVSKETNNDCQPETDNDVKEVEIIKDPLLESSRKEGASEQGLKENQPVENGSQDPSLCLPFPVPPGSTEPSPCSTPCTDHSPTPPPPLDLIVPNAEAMSTTNLCVKDQNEEGQTSQSRATEISNALEDLAKDMAEELVSQQQFEIGQSKEAACVKDSDVTGEELPKEFFEHPTDLLEQTPELSKEHPVEFSILQQQFECVQAKDYTCVKETEAELQDIQEDPTDLLEETPEICEESGTDSQTETELKILQQEFEYGQTDDAFCTKETEEQSQKEDDEDPAGLLEQTISKEDATDSQAQIEISQDIEPLNDLSNSSPPSPSGSNCEVSQMSLDVLLQSQFPSPQNASHKSNTEFVSLSENASVCPSTLNSDAIVAEFTETVPPLLLNSEESLQFVSSCPSESAPVLPPSSFTPPPPEEESGSNSYDLPHKQEPQYPKSLWDAVNRIRKHTAPDSENEEEEVSELWDPESVGEDLGCPDEVMNLNCKDILSHCSEAKQEATVSSPLDNTTGEKEVFKEAGQQKVLQEGSVEDVEVGQIEQEPCHVAPARHAEEDTLSCSSTSSHDSGDTVIIADEDEAEETTPDVIIESKTETDGMLHMAKGKQGCSDEAKDETVAEEEGNGYETESCQIEVKNITTEAKDIMEAGQKQNKEEVRTSTEINTVST
ncbi:uncharacterized protein si:ch211-159e12.5 isoform X2 [Scomber scombrus]|uniref:Uncharacterized protein si:ch211-159e12.5 isoform X2 n=1 Tax=Scomber scombrus TaxID=13677 RepID=A0AAV1N8E1_SCOSC